MGEAEGCEPPMEVEESMLGEAWLRHSLAV